MTKRILIVDDKPGLTFFLAENLTDLGPEYEIITCHSGAEALTLNHDHPFDLVITDALMPGMNGIELMRCLRARDPHLRLILMTAYGIEGMKTATADLNVAQYITKPFTIEAMMLAIQATLAEDANSLASPSR